MKRIASGAFLAAALLLGSSSDAQVDLAKALVGTWEGEVQTLGAGAREDPHRTLIIRSVTQKERKWVGEGRFGVTGQGLGSIQMEVDAGGSSPSIRFALRSGATVRLELLQGKHLVGKMTLPTRGPGDRDRALKLERKE